MTTETSYSPALDEPDFQLFSSFRFDTVLLQSSANTALNGSPSPFYMLPYHKDRMLQAAEHFKWPKAIKQISGPAGLEHLLRKLEAVIDVKSNVPLSPLRVRTVLDYNGNITVETNEIPSVPLQNLFPSRILPPAPKMKVSTLTGGIMSLGVDDYVQSGEAGHGDPQQKQKWTIKPDSAKTRPSPFTSYKTTCRDMYLRARGRVGIETLADPKEVLIISDVGNEIMEGSLTSVFFWRDGRWVTPPVASGGQIGTTRRWLLENGLCEEAIVCSESLVDGEECWISNGVRGLMWGKVKL